MTRTKKLSRNAIVGVLSFAIISALTFVARVFFVRILGFNDAGLLGVLTTIISMLTLAEVGIGASISVRLYKPLAEGDQNKVALLIRYYRKLFYIISAVVLGVGLALLPALPFIVAEYTFLQILFPYLILLGGTVVTYLLSFNTVLLAADQRNFVTSIVNLIAKVIIVAFQLMFLFLVPNFVIFVAVQIVSTALTNFGLYFFVRKLYPVLKEKTKEVLAKEERKIIIAHFKSLIFHKIGNLIIAGVNMLLFSILLSAAVAGQFSNYALITTLTISFSAAVFAGVVSSVGNVLALESPHAAKRVVSNIKLLYLIFFGVFFVGLSVLSNQFVYILFGADGVLPLGFVFVWAANLFIMGYSQPLGDFRFAAGEFRPDRIWYIFYPLVNLGVSVGLFFILPSQHQIMGIMMGTLAATALRDIFIMPNVVYKHVRKEHGEIYRYYNRMMLDFIVVGGITAVAFFINRFISTGRPIVDFILGGIMCVGLTVSVLLAVNCKTKEMKYFMGKLKNLFRRKKDIKQEEGNMKFEKTKLEGVVVIEPKVFGDNRGWFCETYNKALFDKNGAVYDFVQDNHSLSLAKGTLRGLHMQNAPYAQAKLVRCLKGSIFDVAVDLREDSPTYKQWVGVELSSENKKQLMIPRGFAHGFLTLEDNTEVAYKVDNAYNKQSEVGIIYSDSDIGIDWGEVEPVLSDKDKEAKPLNEVQVISEVRVLVTGAKGQLGYDVVERLKSNYAVKGVDIDDFDITNETATMKYVTSFSPDIVVHCAAYTAVDKAEGESEQAFRVNELGTKNLATACKNAGAKMVYISTDYVYNGKGTKPYEVSEKTVPLSIYGKSKLAGENAAKELVDRLYIIRTSWVFGKNGNNFVKTMLRLAKEKDSLSIVSDQIGSPTYTPDLADFIAHLIQTEKFGTYHFSNEGFCSWYDFANEVFKLKGIGIEACKILTKDYKTTAKRPLNSRLSKKSVYDSGYTGIPSWQDALERFLKEKTE